MKITITYNRAQYEVGMEAYEKNMPIQLPNGTIIVVKNWNENTPPQADKITMLQITKGKRISPIDEVRAASAYNPTTKMEQAY